MSTRYYEAFVFPQFNYRAIAKWFGPQLTPSETAQLKTHINDKPRRRIHYNRDLRFTPGNIPIATLRHYMSTSMPVGSMTGETEVAAFRAALNEFNEYMVELGLSTRIPATSVRILNPSPEAIRPRGNSTWVEAFILPRYGLIVVTRIGPVLDEYAIAKQLGIDNVHLISPATMFGGYPRGFVCSGQSLNDNGRVNFDHQLFHDDHNAIDFLISGLTRGTAQLKDDLASLREFLVEYSIALNSDMPNPLFTEVY